MVELGCRGAVVLSTCNRTEVYLSLGEGQDLDPRVLLCQAAGISSGAFDHAFITRWGVDCARHLMEVACGLRSQILGEDQILTQVQSARGPGAGSWQRRRRAGDTLPHCCRLRQVRQGGRAAQRRAYLGGPTGLWRFCGSIWEHWREGPPW